MRLSRSILLIVLLVAISTPAGAEPEASPIPAALAGQIETTEATLFSQLETIPEVLVLEPSDSAEVTGQGEKWRYRTLQLREKSQSNREWNEYWDRQAETAEALIGLYDKAINVLPKDPAGTALREDFAGRRESMREWSVLAADKKKNQDRYLKAIDQEKDGYEKRIEALVQQKASAQVGAATTEAKSEAGSVYPGDDDASPYRKFKNVSRSLKHQRDVQLQKMWDSQSDRELAESLLQASTALLEAQRTDLKLAQREAEISNRSAEAAKIGASWRDSWSQYRQSVNRKLEKLNQTLVNQKRRISQLENEKSYLDAVIEIKNERAQAINAQIEVHETKIVGAVFYTAVDILWRKGLVILGFLLAAWLATRLIGFIGKVIVRRASDGDEKTNTESEKTAGTLVAVFSGVGKAAVVLIVFLLLLDTMGVNISPLMGAFAIFGLAISFGSQNLVKDVVTGFFILFENQVSVGDVVSAGGQSGSVEKVTLRRLVLRDIYGTAHHIPHGQISSLSNLTQAWSRAVIHIGVSYDADLRRVYEVFNDVGKTMFADPAWSPKMLEPLSVVGVTEMADSAIVIRMWGMVVSGNQWSVERDLYVRLHEACRDNGIEIPFPQTVVEIKKPIALDEPRIEKKES
jgi:moderate conductance mechanosensitive channel